MKTKTTVKKPTTKRAVKKSPGVVREAKNQRATRAKKERIVPDLMENQGTILTEKAREPSDVGKDRGTILDDRARSCSNAQSNPLTPTPLPAKPGRGTTTPIAHGYLAGNLQTSPETRNHQGADTRRATRRVLREIAPSETVNDEGAILAMKPRITSDSMNHKGIMLAEEIRKSSEIVNHQGEMQADQIRASLETRNHQGADTPRSPDSKVKSRIPAEVLGSLERACRCGKWICAVFRFENGHVLLDRTAMDFPDGGTAIDVAMRLMVDNLQELKQK